MSIGGDLAGVGAVELLSALRAWRGFAPLSVTTSYAAAAVPTAELMKYSETGTTYRGGAWVNLAMDVAKLVPAGGAMWETVEALESCGAARSQRRRMERE